MAGWARVAVRAREVAGSRPGARSFPPRPDLAMWFSYVGTRNCECNMRNDDCLDGDCGQWRQWSSLPTFHIFCPYLSQFMVGVIAHTHIVPTYCSGGPRFAHQVGLASNPHDPRSPPTCQITHMIACNSRIRTTSRAKSAFRDSSLLIEVDSNQVTMYVAIAIKSNHVSHLTGGWRPQVVEA